MIFSILPIELINTILEYQGYHTWRHGKFICKIQLNDERYTKVNKSPIFKDITTCNYKTIFYVQHKNLYKYIIEIKLYNDKIHWFMDIINIDVLEQQYERSIHYVFGHNVKQHLPYKNMITHK